MEVAVKGKAKRKHLNAQECDDQQHNCEIREALTQPQTSGQRFGRSDPNRGLYPRTPKKRQKIAASAPGSPFENQKAISTFFPVQSILSSSPNKAALSPTSTFPKESSGDEDSDDDGSLLAAINDDGLLAAENVSDCGTSEAATSKDTEESQRDYLEGMTAEMFGDDAEFDSFCEVEPLPNSHYGLVVSSNTLLTPQGCIDDLPEEVLRQILALVPAQDLFCNVSLVCHRWKNIVHDTQFVPHKKQYFRYLMNDQDTVRKLFISLITHNMITQSPTGHCLRNLVRYMAQYKIREHVAPADVLKRVQKHRLFPLAEASISLRIPCIRERFNLGLEGPNPYAAMVVILVISEKVEDVQELVCLLLGCMSITAITEYLSHMATMLLALERNEMQTSSRLHYNVYYVLHLLENGPFTISSSQNGLSQIKLTREQQRIICHKIQPDQVVKIMAFAGTGKTTTLMKYAERNPHLRFLYVAFNNSVACEARQRFPANVECKTVHSLAYSDVGKKYALNKKLGFNLKPFSINAALPTGHGGFSKAKVISTTLNAFMASADQQISESHVPNEYLVRKGIRHFINPAEKQIFVQDANLIWNNMKDLKEKSKHAFYMTHDGYLKLWQLQQPRPCLSGKYDVLFIDEAQDCTPAIMDVLLSQDCGKILVGDPHQQIYTFKGAVNALHIVNHTHIFYLTQSFRFGPEIAYVGATILRVCKKVKKILVGGKQKDGVCDETTNAALEAMRSAVSNSPGKICILSRCNVGVFKEAARLIDKNPQCRIHFIGDVKNIGLEKIKDIYHLMTKPQEEKAKFIKDPMIRSFATRSTKTDDDAFEAFKMYVAQTEDRELEAKLFLVEKYRQRILELATRLNVCHEREISRADFIVGTVHKAKGLQFHTVIVNDDFACVPSARHELEYNQHFSFDKIPDDEWNLIYVAVTRAQNSVVLSKNVLNILSVAGEYFLKSKLPVYGANGQPLPCSIPNCPNCVTPGSAFTMYKQKIQCTGHTTREGPLCERCVWTRVGPVAFLMTDDVLSMANIPRIFERPIPAPAIIQLIF